MGMFNDVLAGLESKEFGNEKFYFDNHGCVVVIRHEENMSFTVYDRAKDCVLLLTETSKAYSIETPIDMRRLFIIPEINKRTDAHLVHESKVEKDIVWEMPKSIFLIADYGFLEDPMYKGVSFSGSKINVAVQNFQGKAFSIFFDVGKGVYGCDKIPPNGNIPDSYTMNPLGILVPEGIVIDI